MFAFLSGSSCTARLHLAAALALFTVMLCVPVLAEKCPDSKPRKTVSPNDSSDTVYGPTCVTVPVNALRYSAVFKSQFALTPGSDLTAPFGASGGRIAAFNTPGAVSLELLNLETQLANLQEKDEALLKDTGRAIAKLKTIVANSDIVFQQQEIAGVRKYIADQGTMQILQANIESSRVRLFDTSDRLIFRLYSLQRDAQALLLSTYGTNDPQKTILGNELSAIKDAITLATSYTQNSDKANLYVKQAQALAFWRDYVQSLFLGDKVFYVSKDIQCRFVGNQNKTASLTLSRLDLLPTIDLLPPTPADLAAPSLIVNCPSPFAVSGGLAVSFVKSDAYGLIPTATSGSYTFGVTQTSNAAPLPIAMVHVVLHEESQHRLALQMGFGVGAHVQDPTAGGTNAEYLAGLGVRLWHTVFITPGLHIGRTASLSSGYHVGDAVASGVTAAPIVTNFTPGFGLALTFTKP